MFNEAVAQQVYNLITNKPDKFRMSDWITTTSEGYGIDDTVTRAVEDSIEISLCGTTACLAGHAAIIGDRVNLLMVPASDDWDDDYFYAHFTQGDVWWEQAGVNALGISERLGQLLFFRSEDNARNALRLLLETGGDEEATIDYLKWAMTAESGCPGCPGCDA